MTNPRTVTRFVEQRVTLGQLFYDTVRELLGLVTKWDEIDAPIQAAYETAIAAVVDAVEDTRADEPPVQRIEPKPVLFKIDASNLEASIAKVQAMIEDANRIKDQPAQPDPTRVLFNGLVVSLASLPVGSMLFVDNLGHFCALHPDGKRVLLSKSAHERIYPPVVTEQRPGFTFGTYEIDPTKARPVAKVGETVTTPLPPSAFPGADPLIPSDS